ncbi:UPF0070 protein YfgM [Buchnera aphidicola (Eriosoma grossulariae)]|uniref:YfgM family protein n=1 Tax=Buchnera aphidicola TaxID=9 RepID=UPI003463E9AA
MFILFKIFIFLNKFMKNKYFFSIFFIFIFMFLVGCYFYKKNEYYEKNIRLQKYSQLMHQLNKKNILYNKRVFKFIIKNKNIYGILISLKLSKIFVQMNYIPFSIQILNFCLPYISDENLKIIIQLRIARMQIEQQNIIIAKKVLNTIKNNNWKKIIEDIKGDLFLLEKNKSLTLYLWKKSLLYQLDKRTKNIIRMKLNYINSH